MGDYIVQLDYSPLDQWTLEKDPDERETALKTAPKSEPLQHHGLPLVGSAKDTKS